MRITLTPLRALLVAAIAAIATFGMLPAPASAQFYVSIGAPPQLPLYDQPQLSSPNQIWMPGYWAWGANGYYWVPGAWVTPPDPGLYYTPGYWGAANNGYQWNQGYWAPQVGYYGGVNYGAGYYGNGYVGGQWAGSNFQYNTAVSNVNPYVIRNVYVNRTVVVRTVNRISYNGGRYGLRVRPTPAQLAVLRLRRVPLTPLQRAHIAEAARDRNFLYRVNNGRPHYVVVTKPLSATNRPPNFKPVTVTHPAPHPAAAAPKPVQPAPKPPVHVAPVQPKTQPAAAKPPPHPAPAKPPVHPAPKPPHPAPAKPPPHPQQAKPPANPHPDQGKQPDNKPPR